MRIPTTITATAAGIGLALALTGCASTPNSTGSTPAPTPTAATSATAVSGSAGDIAFAQLMIPHHQQAIQMADMALASASSEQLKALATQIKAAQDPEIQTMTGWLTSWGAPTSMPGASASDDMAGMDHDMGGMTGAGMMTAEQMDTLAQATGSDFDTMWLQMMIAHHQGAITMAQQVQTTTQNPEVQTLAQSIIDGQTAEITTMRQLLTQPSQ